MAKYLCLRTCFVGDRLWNEGETYDLPDDMEKSPKNFRLAEESILESENFICDKQKKSMDECISEYILDQDTKDATATEIAGALGLNRGHVSHTLKNSSKYAETHREGRSVYYSVKFNQ